MTYLRISMPRNDVLLLHGELSGHLNLTELERHRLRVRLDAALKGKDGRAGNRHNTPRAKGDKATADEMLRQARSKWR